MKTFLTFFFFIPFLLYGQVVWSPPKVVNGLTFNNYDNFVSYTDKNGNHIVINSSGNIRYGFLDKTGGEVVYERIIDTECEYSDYTIALAGYPNSYDAVNALFEKFFAALHHAKDITLASQLLLQLQSLNITTEDFLMRLEVAEFMLNNSSGSLFKGGIAESENKGSNLPKEYSLLGNYPNPFNPSTTISYALPFQSSVELVIYDILGREVKFFYIPFQTSGNQNIIWDGRNNIGNSVTSGIYLYRINMKSLENNSSFTKSSKMIMLK